MSQKYKAWIPTNNGHLSKTRVANTYLPQDWSITNDKLTLIQNNTDEYSDTIFFTEDDLLLSYTLEIDFNTQPFTLETDFNTQPPWLYTLTISVDSFPEVITSKGKIYSNGIIEFSFQSSVDGDQQNLANTVFTIVKNCIHGNNHHDQKVDRFIPVHKHSTFKYSYIAKRLADKIKKNEFESKRLLNDNTTNAHQLSVVNKLNEQARGFKSYYDAYCKIFQAEISRENLSLGYPEAVLLSMESIRKKLEIEVQNSKFAITIFFSILAFLVSSNILIKPKSIDFLENHHLLLIEITCTISILIAIFVDLRYIGIIRKYLSPILKAKEYYQRIYLYGEAISKYNKKIPSDKKKYYYMYQGLKFGNILFGIIFICLAIWGGFNIGKQLKNTTDTNTTISLPLKTQNLIHTNNYLNPKK
ncbi:MAG: hypothetical protein LGB05_06840 [Sulfurovum sp.]|nr:hypothetical protein [Sulfurovum sp.]